MAWLGSGVNTRTAGRQMCSDKSQWPWCWILLLCSPDFQLIRKRERRRRRKHGCTHVNVCAEIIRVRTRGHVKKTVRKKIWIGAQRDQKLWLLQKWPLLVRYSGERVCGRWERKYNISYFLLYWNSLGDSSDGILKRSFNALTSMNAPWLHSFHPELFFFLPLLSMCQAKEAGQFCAFLRIFWDP